jgi:diguanylate cyclase (GGDEF)-like protein
LTAALFSAIMSFMKKNEKTADNSILIVDDNPVVIKLLGAMLTRAGYQVTRADSGHRALELMEAHLPDLILLDIDMPGISGLETCRIIKENPRTTDIPIIFITSSDDKHDIVAGFSAGAQDYIIKPSTKEELLARVRTHLSLCSAQKALKASRARYRELSFLDDLTGLHNTRYLYHNLQSLLDRRPVRPLTVLFMDIDTFKLVVDTHGHLNGSRTIAELAAVIKRLLPKGSYGVSYGGDEFVLVFDGYDSNTGKLLAEKIRAAIEANRFLTSQDQAIRITVSCGIASYPEDAQDMVGLLGNADHALFEAKNRGKNNVAAFAEIQASQPKGNFLPINQ